jgi:integrase
MTRKRAIFDEGLQEKILAVCSESEYIPIWLMLKTGMHSVDVTYRNGRYKVNRKGEKEWHDGLKFDGEYLEYKRCKNDQLREFRIPESIRPKLAHWLKNGRHISPGGLYQLVNRVGERAGVKGLSQMTLRHTFGTEALKRFSGRNDAISFVAATMACSEAVVRRNYLNLDDWQNAGNGEKTRRGFVIEDKPIVPKRRHVRTRPEPTVIVSTPTVTSSTCLSVDSVIAKWQKKQAALST